jgi:hypothetical protein
MLRALSALFAAAILAAPTLAHFIFVVPQPDGKSIQVVFSDDLEPDEGVPIDKIAGLQLSARDGAGKDAPVKATAQKHALSANVPVDTRVLFGSFTYGVMQKTTGDPFQLRYHPKAVVGDAFLMPIGKSVPLEIVAVGKVGSVRFQAVANGKPLAAAEFTVHVPGAETQKMAADAEGLTPAFTKAGRYGVWTKFFEKAKGTQDGKAFDEIRHYATLVVDVGVNK